jgi:hypothetical protein
MWFFLAALRWFLGLSLGLAGLYVIGSQQWGEMIVLIASVIVTVLAVSLINYGPRTYEEYCEQRKKPD